MNKLNEQAQLRSRLFASLVAKQGANVMPGRYGGDYNNDQLAYQENNGVVTLLLGLKLTGDDGGVQLDTESLGPHTQYTKPWCSALVQCLLLNPESVPYGEKIKVALDSGKLVAEVVGMNAETHAVFMIKVEVGD